MPSRAPRITVQPDGSAVLRDAWDLPHTAADLRAALASLEAQAAAPAPPALYTAAIAERRAWLARLEAAEGAHVR